LYAREAANTLAGVLTPASRVTLAPVRRFVERILDFCYPGACVQCGGFCDAKGPLCEGCHLALDALAAEPACARCAKPVAEEGGPCPWCLGRGIYPFRRVIRLAEFTEPVKTLIHQMKYHGRWPLAEFLADRALDELRATDLLKEMDCIVPVPLHFRRQFARHYNQSEVIARRLARRTNLAFVRALKRIRNTETQTRLASQQARQENVRGAFAVSRPRAVAGKRVLLVDDVMTTGATLQAAARALRRAKPASVSAIVIAVADPKRRDFQSI
jgi:ComF family protein